MNRLSLSVTPPEGFPWKARLKPVDELKGLAIILIILYHAGGVLGIRNILHGEEGVDVFLILSGLTLAGAGQTSAMEFAKRRLLRVAPPYWFALSLFVLGGRWVLNQAASPGNILAHYLGLHALVFNRPNLVLSINDSFWFISILWVAYPSYWLLRKQTDVFKVSACGAFLAALLAVLYRHYDNSMGQLHVPGRVLSFFCGLVAARLLEGRSIEVGRSQAPWAAAALLLLCFGEFRRIFTLDQALGGAAIIVAYLAGRRLFDRYSAGASTRLLGTLGGISYELFLLHQPLIRDYPARLMAALGLEATRGRLLLGMAGGLAVAVLLSYGLKAALGRALGPLSGRRAAGDRDAK